MNKKYDFIDYLQTRRSVMAIKLADPGPDEKTLNEMLEIAARTPDHGKLAPWRFIVYSPQQGKAIGERLLARRLQLLGEMSAEQQRFELNKFLRAPVVVGVVSCAGEHPKIPVWEQQLSAGAVCMNLLHAVNAYGFSGQWLTEWYSFDETMSVFLGAGEGERFAGFIHIGTAGDAPKERDRPEISSLIRMYQGE